MEIKLNLIPSGKKKEITESNRLRLVIQLEIFFTVVLIIFFVVLLSFKYILDFSFSVDALAREKNGKVLQYEEIKEYDSQFSEVNSEISKIVMVKNDQPYWSGFFTKLDSVVFPEIGIDSIVTADYAVVVSGISKTRDDLILLKERLEKENCFSNVELPLSNLTNRNNVEFQINFNIESNCLKK